MTSSPPLPTHAVVRGSWLVGATAAAVREPTTFRLRDREWELLPGVFAPTHCVSTDFFTTALPFPVGGAFLEVGCGAGVTTVEAALQGCARVVATDIVGDAVENTRRNAVRHGVADRVELHQGDVFDGLPADDRFDVVFWNSPFIDPGHDGRAGSATGAPRDTLRQAVFDPGYRAHERYVTQAGARLAAGGRLLLGFSDLGDHAALRRITAAAGYRVTVLRSSADAVSGVDYQLLELLPDAD